MSPLIIVMSLCVAWNVTRFVAYIRLPIGSRWRRRLISLAVVGISAGVVAICANLVALELL
jgi:hypothetical protein